MYFVFCVMSLPIFVTHIVWEYPLWSLPLGSTMTLCTRGPPSSYWTATVEPVEKTEGFFLVSLSYYIYFDGPLRPCIVQFSYLYLWVLIDLWQKASYESFDLYCSWAQKPCSHSC